MSNVIRNLVDIINPCSDRYGEESLVWRVMCTIFPDCWCCAGIRGMVYGAIIASIVWWII